MGGIGWEHEIDERTRKWLDEHVHEVTSVILRSERDDEGVDYEVLVRIPNPHAFEEGEDQHGPLWFRRVNFGIRDAERAGGYLFVAASQDQEAVAAMIWQRKRDAI
jgi:hypothetical protein